MWIVKPFMQNETAGLEGRTIEIGAIKVHVRNAIAEGGFSCVYLGHDPANTSKQYAIKHMICQDGESLELAMKEVSVLKLLKGHPNIVTLVAHVVFDMGRRKEVLLVMEFCEKSLVTVLEERGAGYFEEKQVLLIFRDVCNAVFAMHCQSPPIAHRDLKAENVLLGADGPWKLCDFGSTSTNHKRFDKPEEMGIEEDNIRKYTTPAYRAPEMWDLYRREVISEKADIWALGCLLYRICYFRSAFDGESKLQILNGNYRIPELPKYSSSLTGLIKDMLEASPDSRPDITQVWFRVNELLPVELQKHLPDGSAGAIQQLSASDVHDEGVAKRNPIMPRRSPPPPPQSEREKGGGVGAFWSSQHAQDSQVTKEKEPKFNEEPISMNHKSPPREHHARRSIHGSSRRVEDGLTEDFEIRFSSEHRPESKVATQNETFVAEFDTNVNRAEVDRLKEQLKQANLEKTEITSKYEKLSAICRSQQQEIQELKRALAAATPSPASKDSSKSQVSSGSSQFETPPREKIEGTVWELQQGMFSSSSASPSPDPQQWQPFSEDPRGHQQQQQQKMSHPKSVRTINGQQKPIKQSSPSNDGAWGFSEDSFTAHGGPQVMRSLDQGSSSQRFSSSPS